MLLPTSQPFAALAADPVVAEVPAVHVESASVPLPRQNIVASRRTGHGMVGPCTRTPLPAGAGGGGESGGCLHPGPAEG